MHDSLFDCFFSFFSLELQEILSVELNFRLVLAVTDVLHRCFFEAGFDLLDVHGSAVGNVAGLEKTTVLIIIVILLVFDEENVVGTADDRIGDDLHGQNEETFHFRPVQRV